MIGWSSIPQQTLKRIIEQSGACDGAAVGVMRGLMEGTAIATPAGWRPVQDLEAGDLVLTFDEGPVPVAQVKQVRIWEDSHACPSRYWPLNIPAGALGNDKRLFVLPHQPIVIESDRAETVLGDPFVAIPAKVLEGTNGITRGDLQTDKSAVLLFFEDRQVVFTDAGAMFLCPAQDPEKPPKTFGLAQHRVLPYAEARKLLVKEAPPKVRTLRPTERVSDPGLLQGAV